MKISVVMPVKNEEKSIVEVLRSLLLHPTASGPAWSRYALISAFEDVSTCPYELTIDSCELLTLGSSIAVEASI